MENFENMDWEAFPSPADSEAEMKKIRKSIRKRNWKIVLTSVILVIALLVGTIQFAIPALESMYWDPSEATLSKYATDLERTLYVYSELFNPTHDTTNVTYTKTGFATYALTVINTDTNNDWGTQYVTAELKKNSISLPNGFCTYAHEFFFEDEYQEKNGSGLTNHARKILTTLPEYVRVQVCAAFPKDLNLQAVAGLGGTLLYDDLTRNSRVDWIAIRGCDSSSELIPQCGVKTNNYMTDTSLNDTYACFSLNGKGLNRLNLDQHFKSLLQYSIDRLEEGRGIIPLNEQTTTEDDAKANADYYRNVLDYVNTNGVYACGCYLTASPKTILELLDNGTLSSIVIMDAWIGN